MTRSCPESRDSGVLVVAAEGPLTLSVRDEGDAEWGCSMLLNASRGVMSNSLAWPGIPAWRPWPESKEGAGKECMSGGFGVEGSAQVGCGWSWRGE